MCPVSQAVKVKQQRSPSGVLTRLRDYSRLRGIQQT